MRHNQTAVPSELRGVLNPPGLSTLLNGKFVRPPRWEVIEAFVDACRALGCDAYGNLLQELVPHVDLAVWRHRHTALVETLRLQGASQVEVVPPHSFIDPPYQPLRSSAPEVWLLQPRFGVVPYLGREDLLGDLEGWCATEQPFSIGLIVGEGGSGKSRLAAEVCGRMQAHGWGAGLVSRTEALTEFAPESPTLLVVDYPEQWLAVLGAALEQLASRVAGPHVRVLLLARPPAERSHWWADLDRTSHGTASLFTTLRRDLTEHALSLAQRRQHAEAAVQAFARHLGVEICAVPDVTDEEFANPLLVHVAALLAVHGQRGELDASGSVREGVLAHLLDRERSRWARLRSTHYLADLHETHALRAVLVAVLTGPSANESADLLAALPEFSDPAQRERRGRIGYWLAELYPGEPLLASFGPDLLVEELLDVAASGPANLDEVVTAVHHHDANARSLSRLLTTLRLAAEHRPAVFSVLHGYVAANLSALAKQALDDQDGLLATTVDNVLAFCGERKDPELKLALACARLQIEAPPYHERGAQLLCTVMQLALILFRGMAEIDPEQGLDVLLVGLSQLIHRYDQAGRHGEALALNVECVQVRRQLVDQNPDRHLAELAFDLGNLAGAHINLSQHQEALAAIEEAVALQRQLAEEGKRDEAQLAIALHRLSGIQAELGRYDEALAANSEALPILRRRAEQGETYYLPLLVGALGNRGVVLGRQHRHEDGLAATTEAIELRERLAEHQPDEYLPSLQYDLHNLSNVNAELGRYDTALAAAERAVAMSRELTVANPRRHRKVLIKNLDQLARVHLELGPPDDAIAVLEEAVDLGREGTESDLAASLVQLVRLLTDLDRHAEALPVCQEAAMLLRQLTESQPHRLSGLISTLTDLSQILESLNRPDEALTAAQEAVQLGRPLDVSDPVTLARALVNLGDHNLRLERLPEALEYTAEGVELLRPANQPAALAPALAKLADRHAMLQHCDEALAAAVEAVQASETVHQTDRTHRSRIDFTYALTVLSDIHWSFGRPEDGVEPLARAVRLHEELAEADPCRYLPGLARALHSLANIQVANGQYDEAVISLLRGSGLYGQLADTDEDRYLFPFAASLRQLRGSLMRAGQTRDAVPVARQQVEVMRRLVAKDPEFRRLLVESYTELVAILGLVGDFAEASRMAALMEMHQRVAMEEQDGASEPHDA